jgi:DNA-binding NtrC family response regulator
VLEEGAIRPVGAITRCPVDVRIVASTQHDLRALVRERRFREDLYFRLNVAQVPLPPLRERREDVPVLARHFMELLSADLGVAPLPLDAAAVARMQEHDWPGNVRELKNFVERSLMLGELALEQLAQSRRSRRRGGRGLPARLDARGGQGAPHGARAARAGRQQVGGCAAAGHFAQDARAARAARARRERAR